MGVRKGGGTADGRGGNVLITALGRKSHSTFRVTCEKGATGDGLRGRGSKSLQNFREETKTLPLAVSIIYNRKTNLQVSLTLRGRE